MTHTLIGLLALIVLAAAAVAVWSARLRQKKKKGDRSDEIYPLW